MLAWCPSPKRTHTRTQTKYGVAGGYTYNADGTGNAVDEYNGHASGNSGATNANAKGARGDADNEGTDA